MSSIWTPSGEHLPHEEPEEPAGPPGREGAPTPEELAARAEVQACLRSTPAIDIVANHTLALFELALVYLGVGTPPDEMGRGRASALTRSRCARA